MTIPHIVGITGHRDIHPDVYEPINNLVSWWLDEQIHIYGSPLNVRIHSPLAAGADQLVAQLAVEKNIPLIVSLPFPVKRYEKDFTGEELKTFHKLLQKACKVYVPSDIQEETLAYFAVGSKVAQTSHTLLTLWDGKKEPELAGGTAHIVRCQLLGFPKRLVHIDEVQHRETVWINTSRSTETKWEKPKLNILNPNTYSEL